MAAERALDAARLHGLDAYVADADNAALASSSVLVAAEQRAKLGALGRAELEAACPGRAVEGREVCAAFAAELAPLPRRPSTRPGLWCCLPAQDEAQAELARAAAAGAAGYLRTLAPLVSPVCRERAFFAAIHAGQPRTSWALAAVDAATFAFARFVALSHQRAATAFLQAASADPSKKARRARVSLRLFFAAPAATEDLYPVEAELLRELSRWLPPASFQALSTQGPPRDPVECLLVALRAGQWEEVEARLLPLPPLLSTTTPVRTNHDVWLAATTGMRRRGAPSPAVREALALCAQEFAFAFLEAPFCDGDGPFVADILTRTPQLFLDDLPLVRLPRMSLVVARELRRLAPVYRLRLRALGEGDELLFAALA